MGPFQKEYDYFLTLCETLNISRASEILGMQQGGLSKPLKKLEKSLGTELFIRKGRGLQITEFGRLLQRQVLDHQNCGDKGLSRQQETLQDIVGI